MRRTRSVGIGARIARVDRIADCAVVLCERQALGARVGGVRSGLRADAKRIVAGYVIELRGLRGCRGGREKERCQR